MDLSKSSQKDPKTPQGSWTSHSEHRVNESLVQVPAPPLILCDFGDIFQSLRVLFTELTHSESGHGKMRDPTNSSL